MSNIQAMASGRNGFVRALFSGRCGGFAAPVDLLRVQLRVAGRLAAARQSAAVCQRLAEDFGGYLVSDGQKIWRDEFGRVRVIGNAVNYAEGLRDGFKFEEDGEFFRSMDAPIFMPAGCLERGGHGGEVTADVKLFAREGWYK